MRLDLDKLQRRIGYKFRDTDLLLLALSHPSTEYEEVESNRRLEYLGDRVLNVIIAETLYERHPDFDEGMLTQIQARIVRNPSLAAHAKAINLGEYMRTSMSHTQVRTLDGPLADAFEALVGAIKRDGGFDAARDFVLREFTTDLSSVNEPNASDNPKGELQEWLQERSQPTPTYKLISYSGPSDNRSYICAVMCGGVELARGTGGSIKKAEISAARKAVEESKVKQGRSP